MQFWFFFFTHFNFPNQQFYAAKRYIHVTEEGEEDSLFVLSGAVTPSVSAGVIGPLAVKENNRADGTEVNAAPILLSVRMQNLGLEDMVDLCRQGIAINDDKNPAPENVPI